MEIPSSDKIKNDLTINYIDINNNIHEVRHYIDKGDTLIVPILYATLLGYKRNIVNSSKKQISFAGKLTPVQVPHYEIVKKYMENNFSGLFKASTGLGKTFMTLKLISDIGLFPVLIISASINQKDLLLQWKKSIHNLLPTVSVGIIQGNNIDVINKDIILTTISSVRSQKKENLFKTLDIKFTVIDECHHSCSKKNSNILFKVANVEKFFCISATPERPDNFHKILEFWTGKPFHYFERIHEKQVLVDRYILKSDEYKVFHTYNGKLNYTKMITDLISIEKRNELLVDIIEKLYKKGRTILFITDRINHVKIISNMLKKKNINCNEFIGTITSQEDKNFALESKIIIATSKSFGEGIDKKDLDTLILGTPKKYESDTSISFIQTIGRIFRGSGKMDPLIVDIFDDFSVYKSQGYSRLSYYKKNSCKINTIKLHLDNIDEDEIFKINMFELCD